MVQKGKEDKYYINYEFEDGDGIFEWFLNSYCGGKADGKLVMMDSTLLISLLNNRSCEVVSSKTEQTPNGDAYDQRIVICWNKENFPLAFAAINLHGQNSVVKKNGRYRMANNAQEWIVFSHVGFEPDVKNKRGEEFVYGKNINEDQQVAYLIYAPQMYNEIIRKPNKKPSDAKANLAVAIRDFARDLFQKRKEKEEEPQL